MNGIIARTHTPLKPRVERTERPLLAQCSSWIMTLVQVRVESHALPEEGQMVRPALLSCFAGASFAIRHLLAMSLWCIHTPPAQPHQCCILVR